MSTTSPPTHVDGRGRSTLERIGALWTLGVLALIVLAFGLTNPDYFSQAAWLATSIAATQVLLLAMGQTFVISTGGIDLSVGAVLGVSGMTAGITMRELGERGHATPLVITAGIAAALATGIACGVVNGLVVTRLNVSPLIATLGMMGVAGGAANLIGGGKQIGGVPPALSEFGFTNLFGWLPLPVVVASVVAVGSWYLLAKTRFGRRTLAIGSSIDAATRAGIDVSRHVVAIYALSGLTAAIAGFIVVARLSAASPNAGTASELTAIAAVVIGGTSLVGGRSSVMGAVVGTLIIAVLQTGLIVAGVDPYWQVIAVGLILVLAVWADQQRIRLTTRR